MFVWVTCDLTRRTHPCKHCLLEISVFLRNLVKSRRHILITLTSRTKETGWMWWWRWNNSTLFLESPKLLFQSSESELRPHSKNHYGSSHRNHEKEHSYRLRSTSSSFLWKRSVSKRQELLGSVLHSITTKLLLIIRNWSIFKAFGLRKCHIMFVQGRLRNFLKSVLYAQSLFFFYLKVWCIIVFWTFSLRSLSSLLKRFIGGGGRGYALKSSWYIRCDPLPSQDFSYKAKLAKRDSRKKRRND